MASERSPPLPPRPPGGDENRGPGMDALLLILLVLVTVLTILRLYTRLIILKRPGWDDHFNVIGLVTTIVATGLFVASTGSGLGRHVYYLSKDQIARAVEYLIIARVMIICSIVSVKISVATLLTRVFTTRRKIIWFVWICIAVHTLAGLVLAAIVFPSCQPVQRIWDRRVKGKCWSPNIEGDISYLQGAISLAADAVFATLPIPLIWNVQISRVDKFGICTLMGLGYVAAAFVIVRMLYLPVIASSDDVTWDIVNLYVFAILETIVGIFVCCAPTLRPLLGRLKKLRRPPKGSTELPDIPTISECLRQSQWQQRGFNFEIDLYNQLQGKKDSDCSISEEHNGEPSGITLTTEIDVSHDVVTTPELAARTDKLFKRDEVPSTYTNKVSAPKAARRFS